MTHAWGGAQWLLIFLFALRAAIGLGRATGTITVTTPNETPTGIYIRNRVADALLIIMLIWGGFWG